MKNNNNRIVMFLLLINSAALIFGMQSTLRPIDQNFFKNCELGLAIERYHLLGANIFSVDLATGFTAMHYACKSGNLSNIEYLLTHRLDSKLRSKEGLRPIDIARQAGHEGVVQFLWDRDLFDVSDDRSYSFKDFCLRIEYLLKQGASINALGSWNTIESSGTCVFRDNGVNAFLSVCAQGDIDKVRFMLEKKASVHHLSQRGLSPLYIVFIVPGLKEQERLELAQLLIEYGADVNSTTKDKHTVLQAAVRTCGLQASMFLLEKKIIFNTIDNAGHNALHEAINYQKEDLFKLLLDAGVPLVERDIEGISLLHSAVLKPNEKIIENLIACGVDINIVDCDDQSALHYASEYATSRVVKILLDAGALQTADRNGRTPLMLSQKNKNKGVSLLLRNALKKITANTAKINDVKIKSIESLSQIVVIDKATNTHKKKTPKAKKKKKKAKKASLSLMQDKSDTIEVLDVAQIVQSGTSLIVDVLPEVQDVSVVVIQHERTLTKIESKKETITVENVVQMTESTQFSQLIQPVEVLQRALPLLLEKKTDRDEKSKKDKPAREESEKRRHLTISSVARTLKQRAHDIIPPQINYAAAVMTEGWRSLAQITRYYDRAGRSIQLHLPAGLGASVPNILENFHDTNHVASKERNEGDIFHTVPRKIKEVVVMHGRCFNVGNNVECYQIPATREASGKKPRNGYMEISINRTDQKIIHAFFNPHKKSSPDNLITQK